jgi:hypothetical protein
MWVGSLPDARAWFTRLAFAPDGLTCAAGGPGALVVFDTEG